LFDDGLTMPWGKEHALLARSYARCLALSLLIAMGVGVAPSSFAQALLDIGGVSNIRPEATQKPPSAAIQTLTAKNRIYRNAELETKADGRLEVTFADNSKLSMNGGSIAVLDEFAYTGPQSTQAQIIKYGKGFFRFISGEIPKEKVNIKTPTVLIGIRGTEVRTVVTDDGTTTVGVDHGQVLVTSIQTGQMRTLEVGEKVTIKPTGEFGSVILGKVEGCN
jgi:hypothetical protein